MIKRLLAWLETRKRKAKCYIFGHELTLIESLSEQADKLGCKKCGGVFAICWSVQGGSILKWDRELEKFYDNLNRIRENNTQ